MDTMAMQTVKNEYSGDFRALNAGGHTYVHVMETRHFGCEPPSHTAEKVEGRMRHFSNWEEYLRLKQRGHFSKLQKAKSSLAYKNAIAAAPVDCAAGGVR